MAVRKRSYMIITFVLGFLLGFLISYAISIISNMSTCASDFQDEFIEEPQDSTILENKQIDPVMHINLPNKDSRCNSKDCTIPMGTSQGLSETFEKSFTNSSRQDKRQKSRKFLMVGVMTASVYLPTRAKAVWETWAKDVPGKIVFFTGGITFNSEQMKARLNNSFLPLVVLPDVDDSYPPQKKSFMMLKYMNDNFGDEFEWFMRADDDVYVRNDKLAALLRSVDSRQRHFIGQAGMGNELEKGTLNLAHNENFCMGGPGIIFSRPVLNLIGPNLEDCLQNMYTAHEDVEVGRCVRKFAGVSCTWAYEMQTVFHHNSSGENAFTGKLKRREVHRAITLHPIKSYQHFYRVHSYFQSLKIQELLQEKIMINRELIIVDNILTQYKNSDSVQAGVLDTFYKDLKPSLTKFYPSNLNDVIPWTFFTKMVYSPENNSPKQKFKNYEKEGLEDILRDVMDIINGVSRIRGRVVDFKEVLYGYKRIDPLHGLDYILDLLLTYKKYRGRKMTIPVRRHVYARRSFGPLEIRLLPTKKSSTRTKLVMIVPLSGRLESFRRFLKKFSEVCIQHDSNEFELRLITVFFGTDLEKENFLALVNQRRELLVQSQSDCSIKIVQVEGEFSRGMALETGISQCNDEDLLFLIDVDLIFNIDVIKRVYLNTEKGQQAYFPIVFSQYNPKFGTGTRNATEGIAPSFSNTEFDDDWGYWREFGFGIAAFYKSDFRVAGGFDTTIKGWGKEDVALFDKFLQNTNLTIFRAPDPDLIHIFHETLCSAALPKAQHDMCIGSKLNTMASVKNLMRYLCNQTSYKNCN